MVICWEGGSSTLANLFDTGSAVFIWHREIAAQFLQQDKLSSLGSEENIKEPCNDFLFNFQVSSRSKTDFSIMQIFCF